MRAVVMVMQGRFRQYWKSFPKFAARHGYDVIVYSGHQLPQLARLPHVVSALPVPATFTGQLRCASCHTPIDSNSMLINEVPPRELPRLARCGTPPCICGRPASSSRGRTL